jgi:hypothetical protein
MKEITLRMDSAFCQVAAAAVTSFFQTIDRVCPLSPHEMERIRCVGYLLHFESLLSTHKSEVLCIFVRERKRKRKRESEERERGREISLTLYEVGHAL